MSQATKRTMRACAFGVALGVLASAPLAAAEAGRMTHGGMERTYLVQPAAKPNAPVVMLLHGGTQDAASVWEQTSLPRLAASHGFTLVAPDAVNGTWNDGRWGMTPQPGRADDVGFIVALVDRVLAETGGDRRRVFVTGASNGGQMTYRLACERADRFAGATPVIGGLLPKPEQWCRPSRSVPMLAMNGTADPITTFDGSPARIARDRVAPRLPQAEALAFWAKVNRCKAAKTEALHVREASDPTRVHVTRWSGCAAPVLHYVIEGGGHTWPNGPSLGLVGRRMLGTTTRQIDAGETIWAFFSGL